MLTEKNVREFTIRKRSGKLRHIVAPNKEAKEELRRYLNDLHTYNMGPYAHGFVHMRNPVTNARPHINYDISINMDLEDFFDTVTEEHLKGRVPEEIINNCLYKGRAAQGLPTSPLLANIAAIKMDTAIAKALKKLCGKDFAYTRYADDLTISIKEKDREVIEKIVERVIFIVTNNHFKVNKDKTRVQYAKHGSREVCGVLIKNDGTLRASRRIRRLHRYFNYKKGKKHHVTRGLGEWCAMKTPKDRTIGGNNPRYVEEANRILAYHDVRPIGTNKKTFIEEKIGKSRITTDPRYFAGMSSLGNGWTSCMRLEQNQYKYGIPMWHELEGCAIAYLPSGKKMVLGGGSTPLDTFDARALIFKTRDGAKVYSRVFGNTAGRMTLENDLKAAGFVSAWDRRRAGQSDKVIGNVGRKGRNSQSSGGMPYCDYGQFVSAHINEKGNRREVFVYYI